MINLNQNLDNESKHLPINNKIVESVIIKEEFNVFAGTFTICTLTLKNGYEVFGQHTCPDHAEYVEQVSRRLARENACEKIWSLEAYALKERQSQNGSLASIPKQDRKWKEMDQFVWLEDKEFVVKGDFHRKRIGRCYLNHTNLIIGEKYLDIFGLKTMHLKDAIMDKMQYFELPEDR